MKNKLKRLMSVMLVISLILVFSSCSKKSLSEEIVGIWVSPEEVESFIHFYDDGSVVFGDYEYILGEYSITESDGTLRIDGFKMIDGFDGFEEIYEYDEWGDAIDYVDDYQDLAYSIIDNLSPRYFENLGEDIEYGEVSITLKYMESAEGFDEWYISGDNLFFGGEEYVRISN